MRSVVFVAVIGALLAACTVAEAGVVWATVPGPALYSTLYKVDPTTGKSLGGIADLPLPADDVSFANDGLSFWGADSARGFPKECSEWMGLPSQQAPEIVAWIDFKTLQT